MFVRALAAVLGAASLAMLVHSVANPLYDDQVNAGAIWDTLSWIMAVGFPLALVVAYRLKTEATASEAASDGAILSTVCVLCNRIRGSRVLSAYSSAASRTWKRKTQSAASGGYQ